VKNIDAHIQDYVISNNNRWRDVPNDWTALIDGVFQPSGFVCEKGDTHFTCVTFEIYVLH